MMLKCLSRAFTFLCLLCITVGCRSVCDPSCSIQEELGTVACRDVLYRPEVLTDPLNEGCWESFPQLYGGACGSSFVFTPYPRTIADPHQVFALPDAEMAPPAPGSRIPE